MSTFIWSRSSINFECRWKKAVRIMANLQNVFGFEVWDGFWISLRRRLSRRLIRPQKPSQTSKFLLQSNHKNYVFVGRGCHLKICNIQVWTLISRDPLGRFWRDQTYWKRSHSLLLIQNMNIGFHCLRPILAQI
jgi:hypothetical protein